MSEHLSGEEARVVNKKHYAYQVRMLIDMFNQGALPEVEAIVVEPRYGYIASIQYVNGTSRVIYGHDAGFNPGSSQMLANDKGYTKFMLRQLGVQCPNGEEFILPWWSERLKDSGSLPEDANIYDVNVVDGYIKENTSYPAYIKPVSGSQGMGVQKIYDRDDLDSVISEYDSDRVRVALVEESLDMPDYRLLVFDGELVNAYERRPLSVTGDGFKSIKELLDDLQERYQDQGREVKLGKYEADIAKRLGRYGLSMVSIPDAEQRLQLLSVSNLSAGGTPVDVSNELHDHWKDVARKVAHGFNLRICGVDLACKDISSPDSDYGVIEVNATPGAKQFMASGEQGREKLENLFLQFFRTSN